MDTSKPNFARVYDYWLGGKDNYTVDHDVAGRMLEHDPGLRDRVRDNREFVTGVARLAAFLAGLDLIPPGIAEVRRWLSGIAGTPKCKPAYLVCGVGAKP